MNVIIQKLDFSSKYYQQILLLLRANGGNARIIGGAVRDALLDRPSSDIDIATDLLPQQIFDILLPAGIQVIPTGIKFGTVTALLYEEKFEITTLRKDIKCTGRYAEVDFTNNFMEDAARRDFTINALSYCPLEHKIYDYFTGIEDLKNREVRFIGEAEQRIKEDFLRILRFFRFSCYYAQQINAVGLEAAVQLKDGLKIISKERIKTELDKILLSDNFPYILQVMFNTGILSIISPIKYYYLHIIEKAVGLELCTKYALLFCNFEELNLVDLIKLKFSNKEAKKIYSIIKFITVQKITDFSLKKIWLQNQDYKEYLNAALALDKLSLKIVQEFINKYDLIAKPIFPIRGQDMLQLNIKNKNIGKSLKYLEELWIESDFTLIKEQLIGLLTNET